MLIPNPGDRFKERASAGGKGKAARNSEEVKEKVIKLFVSLKPEGWESEGLTFS